MKKPKPTDVLTSADVRRAAAQLRADEKTAQFVTIGADVGRLVAEKNAAYGSAFERTGEILRILFPDGIPPEKFVDALGITRCLDKFFRIATRKDAFGENPWRDVAGYSLLAVERDARAKS